MTRTLTALALLLSLAATPVFADDQFMAIHMNNQKIGSPVADYWGSLTKTPAPPAVDGYAAIYMDNQKIGSAVVSYWLQLSGSDWPSVEVAQASH